MNDAHRNRAISITALLKQQKIFQKDLGELITIYIHDAQKILSHLQQSFEENNLVMLIQHTQELRYRSIEMGALQFSHYCLSIEIAAQEYRLESLKKLLALLENQFTIMIEQFEEIKATKLT